MWSSACATRQLLKEQARGAEKGPKKSPSVGFEQRRGADIAFCSRSRQCVHFGPTEHPSRAPDASADSQTDADEPSGPQHAVSTALPSRNSLRTRAHHLSIPAATIKGPQDGTRLQSSAAAASSAEFSWWPGRPDLLVAADQPGERPDSARPAPTGAGAQHAHRHRKAVLAPARGRLKVVTRATHQSSPPHFAGCPAAQPRLERRPLGARA